MSITIKQVQFGKYLVEGEAFTSLKDATRYARQEALKLSCLLGMNVEVSNHIFY